MTGLLPFVENTRMRMYNLQKKKIKVIAPLEKLQFSNDAMNFVVSFENTTAHLILMKNKQASQGVFLKKVFSLSFLRCKHIAKKESNVLRSRSQKIRYPVIILLFTDKNLQANGKEHSIFFCFNFHAGIFKRLHSGLNLSTYFKFAYLFPASQFSGHLNFTLDHCVLPDIQV